MIQQPAACQIQAGTKLLYKNIELDTASGLVCKDGHPLACVWGVSMPLRTRTVDMHIRQLRRKLGPELDIVTVFKVGYRLT